jgi:hypothetical protein
MRPWIASPNGQSHPVAHYVSLRTMGGVIIALVLWGFLALLVWTAIYHAVKLGVRDALRERDTERKRASDGGGHRD